MARLRDALAERVLRAPDDPALLVPGGERLSWAELGARVDALAGELTAAGLADGGRIVSLTRSGMDATILLHAALQIGACLVPVNTRLTAGEVAEQVSTVMPDLLVADGEYSHLLPSHTGSPRWIGSERAGAPPMWRAERHAALHASVVVFTSGTTGDARPVLLMAENLEASARGSIALLGLRTADCWAACVPLYHVAGISILVRSLLFGCSVELHERFDPAALNESIGAGVVTHLSVVPTMLRRMLDDPSATSLPGGLQCVMVGGGPIAPELVQQALSRGIPVAPTYGLTEAGSTVTVLRADEAAKRPASAGKPIPGVDLRVAQADGTTALARELGEIEVRGGPVSRVGIDGGGIRARADWLRTGDLGWLDPEGYLFVADRRTDLIVSGGENVMPAEVERVLESHPAVAEAGVYGETDLEWGQVVCAAVVARADSSASVGDLDMHCRSLLAGYKVPRRIRFVEELPRTASGKVRRHELSRL